MAPVQSTRRRVLVVATDTVADDLLGEVVRGTAADVLVVAPALNGRLAHWSSDEDRARRAATHRLTGWLEALRARGVTAEGIVGDADPLLAIDDSLRLYAADEIVIAAHHEDRCNWLERRAVRRARERYRQPVRRI